jgi:RNA polymerase sigma-70 factor, ECF subfamily
MPRHSPAHLSLVVDADRRTIDDAELARALAAAEAWAVTEVWYRFAPMVLRTAEAALGSRSEAEDLAQEVFCRLYRQINSLREPGSLRSFIYSIAIRTLKSQLRYRRLRNWLSFHAPETLQDLRHTTPDVEGRDHLRRFYALLDRLSPRDRLVFVLRRVESMTVEEIAATLDLSPSTVKRSMAHASERLSYWVSCDPGLAELPDGEVERWE